MSREQKVPTSKLSRFSKLGSLALKVAGNVVVDGAKQWSKGQPSSVRDLVLQPKNIENLADKLSQLRGAAMKVGQLLSMDAGDLLPPELSQLLDKLRSNAQHMPHKQLVSVLQQAWGDHWLDHFSHFELKPFAAASIGQVHIAYHENGEKLAVKIQYPGVAKAISSDVDNVATLLKVSGLLPAHMQIDHLLLEAKRQLLVEADYCAEADFVAAYHAKLSADSFIIPKVNQELSRDTILVMNYIDGVTVDTLTDATQAVRDQVATELLALFFEELFNFKLMQTDPNFANYLYQSETNKIVLLDFGATRVIPDHISAGYKSLIHAGSQEDFSGMMAAAKKLGFFADDICPEFRQNILTLFKLACEPIRFDGAYDFGASGLAERIKNTAMAINRKQDQWHTPPIDAIFIHRKLGGLYLLAAKLNAKIDVKQLFSRYITHDHSKA